MFPQSLNFQPVNTDQYCMSGDVTIFPGAAIAPGVLLQADVGSRIVIRAGVCIGLGSVIHATHGTITINDGANLGAGVLLIGDVTIGARACLGSAVTVINSAVAARAILESGLVVGDRSRRESIDDIINDIPMNSTNQTVVVANPVSTNSVVSNSISNSNASGNADPIAAPKVVVPDLTLEALTPATSDSIALAPTTSIVSTFKYPEEPSLDISTPAIVLDNSGQPWQTCDPNPWDPKHHPVGETTCQITSTPKEATPYNPDLFSSQTNASPYPPYPQPPQLSTESVSTFKYPEPINQITVQEITLEEPKKEPIEPKAVYGQDYVNRMLGKLSGRS